ncbi:MAG: cell division protein FtsQ/DivIB [Pseudorhodobacter sp.]
MRSLNPFRRNRRRDPAPSRMAYRMNRLWLTPAFRTTLRVGLPAFALAFAAGLYLSDDGRRETLAQTWTDLRDSVKNRPEFLVTLMSVEGASPVLADQVRAALALPLPQSSLDIDLEAARLRVSEIAAVKDVRLRVQTGGVLQVVVTERLPAIVWRGPEGLNLLDESGHLVTHVVSRAERRDLPLVAGQGADRAIPEALRIMASAGPLLPRLRGLVRMGERRWDLVLDRDQRILLPVKDPIRALERLIALDQAQELLERDVIAVDLRDEGRPTLRLSPYALTELRRLRGILPVEESL